MCNNQVPYLYLPGFTGKGSTCSKHFFRPNVTFFFAQMYTWLRMRFRPNVICPNRVAKIDKGYLYPRKEAIWINNNYMLHFYHPDQKCYLPRIQS